MNPPAQHHKDYNALYHDFTEAYTSVYSLSREFYPQAKKFVEHTEPELTSFVEKISNAEREKGGPVAYEKVVLYMSHFDDFTLMANRLFADLKNMLERSDKFMNRLIDLKMSMEGKPNDGGCERYKELLPELDALVSGLKQMPERATKLALKMKKLEGDWRNTKEKIQ